MTPVTSRMLGQPKGEPIPMFRKTFHATHPVMMDSVANDDLRARYLVEGMFAEGEISLNYSHNERFVIGGVVPKGTAIRLPDQSEPASAKGHPFLERREMAAVNIGGPGAITVDGQRFETGNKECLYIPMGSREVAFEGDGARFYLASLPAHKACPIKHITLAQANPLERGDLANSNHRTIYQLVIPGVCESAQLLLGLTVLEEGSVWNTMPPHLHDRRSEIYLYFDLPAESRVMHFMGTPQEMRTLVMADRQAVASPAWSMHFGAGTHNYRFIWAMGGENQAFDDMDGIAVSKLR